MIERKELLDKYLPAETSDVISEWISMYNIHLRITKNRTTKHGDYYPPVKSQYHRITVNHDLNKYAFLVTLVHEVAHLRVWELYKNKVKPHGREWKMEFRNLMIPFLNRGVFPGDVNDALEKYLINAKASTSSDLDLSRALGKYDAINSKIVLENIPSQTVFRLRNGKTYRKGDRLRKRYRCMCLNNNRIYLINPLVEVIPLK